MPQGGVISPLLANVYLNEVDQWAAAQWDLNRKARERRRKEGLGNYKVVRYADDFMVAGNGTKAEVKAIKEAIQQFLENELCLTLSEEKTVIIHVNDGFDFLGFHIQRKQVNGNWAVHLRPTAKAKERVKRKLKDLTSSNWTWMDEYTRLTTLNAIVRGWAGPNTTGTLASCETSRTSRASHGSATSTGCGRSTREATRGNSSEANPRGSMAESVGMLRCAKVITRWKPTNGSPLHMSLTDGATGRREQRDSRIPTCPATQRRRATILREQPAQTSGSTRRLLGLAA